VKLDFEQIRFINALDEMTRATAKDCFIHEGSIVFLVPSKHMRKAIGKNGVTIQKVKEKLGKPIELFEYYENPEGFFEKAFYKASVEKVEIRKTNDRTIAFVKTKSDDKKIILNNLRRLDKIKELAKRNYNIEEVRIR